jgi:hypothetical protein
MKINGMEPCQGKTLPLNGTVKLQRKRIKPHSRAFGARVAHAWEFGPRTGAAVRAIHSHILATKGGSADVTTAPFSSSTNLSARSLNQFGSSIGKQ